MSKRSSDPLYIDWKETVIDTYKKCVVCDSTDKLCAHHLNSWKYFPNERYDLDNGVALCTKCHIVFHTDFKRNYNMKCTKYDFNNFLRLSKYFISK